MSNEARSAAKKPAQLPASTAERGNLLRDIVVVVAITGVMFLGFETAVRTLAPQKLETTVLGEESVGMPDDLVGHVNRPNAHVQVKGPEYEADYRISGQGFRDAGQYSTFPEAGVTRILLVGDSFAFGVGNKYEEAWPTVLENSLLDSGHRVEIIKAGVPAHDTNREVLYIERLAELYHPTKVLITFLPNDLFTNRPIYEENSGNYREKPEDVAVRAKGDKKSTLHSVTLLKRLLLQNDALYTRLYLMTARADYFTMPATDTMNKQMEITQSLLARAHEFCSSNGIDLAVVSIPQQFQVLAAANSDNSLVDGNYIDREFMKFGAERNLAWFPVLPSLTEAYVSKGVDAYYRFDGHLNPDGNSIVASALLGPIQEWLDSTKPASPVAESAVR